MGIGFDSLLEDDLASDGVGVSRDCGDHRLSRLFDIGAQPSRGNRSLMDHNRPPDDREFAKEAEKDKTFIKDIAAHSKVFR